MTKTEKNPLEIIAKLAKEDPELAKQMFTGKTGEVHDDLGQALGSAIDALKKKDNLELLTELEPNQVKLITAILARASITKNRIAPVVCNYLIEYMVSKNRSGRAEICDITKSVQQEVKQSMGGLSTRLKSFMGI